MLGAACGQVLDRCDNVRRPMSQKCKTPATRHRNIRPLFTAAQIGTRRQRRTRPTPGSAMNADFERIAAVWQRDRITRPSATHDTPVRPRRRPLRRWWQRLWMDERTAYLSEATSHADLESRIRTWDAADRRGRVPLV